MNDFIEVHTNNFDELVLNAEKLVLVYFWAEWCGPCYMANDILKQIVKENEDILTIVKVNADIETSLVDQYNINKLPTVLFCYQGKIEEEIYGAIPRLHIIDKIRRICNEKELR